MTWATKLPATIIATAGTALLLATTSASAARMPLDARRMADLQEVNAHVNATVIEVSDRELYGKDDVWALPVNGKGDCEDFALLKRKLLVERGWPASALKIAAVTTPQGEAHAVLAAATDKGTSCSTTGSRAWCRPRPRAMPSTRPKRPGASGGT
jgi:predicted transglutaminase-like cysteine proteinase